MRLFFSTFFVLAAVSANPAGSGRIVGGFQTIIEQYPFSASLLRHVSGNNFRIECGGSVINNRAILTAAQCVENTAASAWRIRVGSTNAHSGGTVHVVGRIILNPNFRRQTLDSDIALVHSTNAFVFSNTVRPGPIAGANYNVADDTPVWAIGWGALGFMGNTVEQLRHVQVRTINHATCRMRYVELDQAITDNMICSGLLDIGGRGQCGGDTGSPVLHGNVIMGITSFSFMCAQPRYPAVNVRVSRFTSWILANA